jgi:hypothetical protein
VIRNNSGLCIELALLWASVMEHFNIPAYIVHVPGHAYVRAPQLDPVFGGPFVIECTAITPKSVGATNYISFLDAVKMAARNYAENSARGELIEVNIRELQSAGIVPPELPDVDLERIKELLASRKRGRLRSELNVKPHTAALVTEKAGDLRGSTGFRRYAGPEDAELWNYASLP